MGLDAVELLLAVEEEFEVEIPDRAALRLETPRMLAEYIYSLRVGEPEGCHSQAAFYRLRAALVKLTGAKRRVVRLETHLAELLRQDNIREQWAALENAIGATDFPRLKSGRARKATLVLATLLVALLLAWWRVPQTLYGLVCLGLLMADQFILYKFGTLIPENVSTVRSLVPYVQLQSRKEASFEEILQKVIRITAEQTLLAEEQIQPDHHFVKDLGLD